MLSELFLAALLIGTYFMNKYVLIVGLFIVYLAFMPPTFLLNYLNQRDGVVFFPRQTKERLKVHLTIDDVPTADTGEILEALRECGNAKAIFFVIGSYASKHPEVLKQIVAEGHQLGNHDDENHMTVSPLRNAGDIQQGLIACDRTIHDIIPDYGKIKFVRPGCGVYNKTLIDVAKFLGYKILLGDVYGHDCQMQFFPGFLVRKTI